MPREGWVDVALPEEIVERIDRVVAEKKHGIRSRNSFVNEAVKDYLKKFGAYP